MEPKNSDKIVFFNKHVMTEDQKKYTEKFLGKNIMELVPFSVKYTPDCGCAVEVFIALDRYPMSQKRSSICKLCNKNCFLEVSDPVKFYIHIINTDYTPVDLKKGIYMECPQSHLIQQYSEEKKAP